MCTVHLREQMHAAVQRHGQLAFAGFRLSQAVYEHMHQKVLHLCRKGGGGEVWIRHGAFQAHC